MKKKVRNEIPEIIVPKGYDILDLIDTDSDGYEFGAPIIMEEVKIRFEREEGAE